MGRSEITMDGDILFYVPKPNVLEVWKKEKHEKELIRYEKSKIEGERLAAFNEWLARSVPKDKFCYYVGEYIADTLLGRVARRAYDNGHVVLYQKREKNENFSYWAQRCIKKERRDV